MTIDPSNAKLDLNLRVRDLTASIDWYTRMFGAPPIYQGVDRALDGAAVQMACFRIGGVKVWLLPRLTDAPTSPTQSVGMALMTRQPLVEVRRELTRRGAVFDDSPRPNFNVDENGLRVGLDAEFFYILDPDGHRWEYCRTF